MEFPYLDQLVGKTPLVRLKRISAGRNNVLLAKLEGDNPAGSVRSLSIASSVVRECQECGDWDSAASFVSQARWSIWAGPNQVVNGATFSLSKATSMLPDLKQFNWSDLS